MIFRVNLTDLIFERNKCDHGSISKTPADLQHTVGIISLKSLNMSNCTFKDNIGSAMFIYDTPVHFIGNNTFINNTGTNKGGALHITNAAFILLNSRSKLNFIDNNAKIYGGAIFISQLLTDIFENVGSDKVSAYCFYQFTEQLVSNTTDIFFFQNNSADTAGSAVYGGLTDNCLSIVARTAVDGNYFYNISSFIDQPGDSVISSSPRGVCFCSDDDKIDCSQGIIHTNSFPRGNITFSLVVVGNRNGSTPGIIETVTSLESTTTKLEEKCSNVPLFIRINNDRSSTMSEIITITAANIQQSLFQRKLIVNVTIDNCSLGFELKENGICECIERVFNLTKCFSSLQLVERSDSVWVGYSNKLNCTLATSNCPFDYCDTNNSNVSLSNPNLQCAHNRGNQFCGSCISDNYSLVLGSNACKSCKSNAYVLITIPIGIAGIVLVGFIFFLNLTVAVGTINGLIFFANIVKIYEKFFSFEPICFLSRFISWLNLDMGIETCFYSGMNAYQKVGLQFAFPFYLWLIIIVIIIVSKYSQKVAKFTGNNTIPVLATVILLSYTKLLRTVILIFSISHLKCDTKTLMYWYVDPTQRYLHSPQHILLFIMALLVMVFLIFPFTVFLLLYPLLEMSPEKCRQKFSWFLFKLKPFFDSYRAPYTNLFCFWPGALLLVRIGLALSIALRDKPYIPLTCSFVTLVLLIGIFSIGIIYKSESRLPLLDATFLAALLFITYLLNNTHGDKAKNGTIPIVSFVFIVFLAIVIYHLWKYTRRVRLCKCIKTSSNDGVMDVNSSMEGNKNGSRPVSSTIVNVGRYNEMRESLLDETY